MQIKNLTPVLAKTKALAGLWTFPTILFSSFVIGWGAEAAQFYISQGLALAILAWLQTLPEFAVEARIAWEQDTHMMLANLTGSLRLIVGLGWPMIYFVRAFLAHKKEDGKRFAPIHLEDEHALGTLSLLPPLLYFAFVLFKQTLFYYDGIVLFCCYAAYLWLLRKAPPEELDGAQNDLPWVPRKIVALPKPWSIAAIVSLFLLGGIGLYVCVEPFLESLHGLAFLFGVPAYYFVQWIAPFLSEFPEKLTAFNWARKPKKAPMALMNMVSSNINQWTLLVCMMLFVYSWSRGELSGFHLDTEQITELTLTLAQSTLGFLILLDLKFKWYEAILIFTLWVVQFAKPHLREEITLVYWGFSALYLAVAVRKNKRLRAFIAFKHFFTSDKEPART